MPIIIPQHRTRECIVVEGKKFCETSDLTGKDFGIVLMICVLLVSYVILLCWLWTDKEIHFGLVFGLGLALPTFVVGFVLAVF